VISASFRWFAIAAATATLLVACGKKGGPPPQQSVEVTVATAKAQSVPLTRELVGRLSATRSADVRARVAGVLQKRLYKEGSTVTAGQAMFQIDPAPLRATLAGAEASLAQAQAAATNAAVTAKRNRELAPGGLVSRSALDDSEAAERSTAAQVLQAKAALETARINLSYATVTSPIAGRSGQQRVTEGALVGQGEATLLTTVEQIDPIYVNFDQPAAEIEQLRRQQTAGTVKLVDGNSARVTVLFQDGTPYPQEGTLDFSDFSVNPTTGALAFRAVVPNPDRRLLPGMYVSLRLTLGELKRAFLVPQAGLQRDGQGPFVRVVGADGKVVQKRVESDLALGGNWIVTTGLAEGDQLIVSNFAKARPGTMVKVVTGASSEGKASGAPSDAGAPAQATGAPNSGASAAGAARGSGARADGSAPSASQNGAAAPANTPAKQ
jgi:membrane fusion protein, multidrug efflux system